ncbi:hypothetical protein H8356DRAFT_1347202 [Neocallimastix lanati (nom. inval.)]|nr:hypothetical protein H8356DRAFT_1347202 [Neocallimastix sp. JGI-2020a]
MKKSNDNINNNYNNNREDNYNIVKNNKKVYMKPPERHLDYNKKIFKVIYRFKLRTHNGKLREHISKKLCLPQKYLGYGLIECSSNWRYVIQNIIENFLSIFPVPNFPFKTSLLGNCILIRQIALRIPFVDIFNSSNCAPPLRARKYLLLIIAIKFNLSIKNIDDKENKKSRKGSISQN